MKCQCQLYYERAFSPWICQSNKFMLSVKVLEVGDILFGHSFNIVLKLYVNIIVILKHLLLIKSCVVFFSGFIQQIGFHVHFLNSFLFILLKNFIYLGLECPNFIFLPCFLLWRRPHFRQPLSWGQLGRSLGWRSCLLPFCTSNDATVPDLRGVQPCCRETYLPSSMKNSSSHKED